MNYKDRQIIEIAQKFGYTTAKEFAKFLKIYNPAIGANNNGEKFILLDIV